MEKPVEDMNRKLRAARLSVVAALFLSVLKMTTGLLFNSLGMVSAGVDSIMDLVASSINFFSMKKSIQPADQDHPYGHGKIENLASMFQAVILAAAGIALVGEGIRQVLYAKAQPHFDAGILVMIFSGIVSFAVGRKLEHVGKETDSPLLQADSVHFSMDTYTNAGVVAGLLLSQWQGEVFFDRLAGVIIGLWVLFAAVRIFRNALDALMDKYIPQELRKEIGKIILSHSPEIMGYHKMRTRRAGSQKLIDLHLVTCKERSLTDAHNIADHIEKEIESRIKSSDVIIHVEPCTKGCPEKKDECEFLYKSGT